MPDTNGNETISIVVRGSSESAVRATTAATTGLKQVEVQSHKTSSAVKTHAREAVEANALLTGSFRSMARSAVTAGAGFAVAYVGIAKAKDAIATTTDLARQTEILSRNTGLATKTTSAMLVTLKALGVDTAGVSMSFQTLGRNVAQAEAGSKKTQAAFSALGITTRDIKAAHGDLNILLPKIADGFGNLKGNADRLAVSQALLGRGYKSLLPLFADGAAGLQKQIDTAEKFGAVIDGKTLAQLERLHNAQVKNREAALGLKIAFAQAATPALLGISTVAQKVATDLEGPGSLDDKLSKIGKDVGPALSKVEGLFEAAIPKIANEVGRDAPKVAKAFFDGFTRADALGQAAMLVFFAKRFGLLGPAFAAAGKQLGAIWSGTFGSTVAVGAEAAMTEASAVVMTMGGASWTLAGEKAGGAFTAGFAPVATGGAAAAGKTAGMVFAAGLRRFMFLGVAGAVTAFLYKDVVGPFNKALEDITGQLNATDPTNGKAQANADARAGHIKGVKGPTTIGTVVGDTIKAVNHALGLGAYGTATKNAALGAGIDPAAFLKQIRIESMNFDPDVIAGRKRSPAGAIGIAQFMPATAKGLGVNPYNPSASLIAAAKLMASYTQKYGSLEKALIAYNAGPGMVNTPFSQLPKETQNYVSNIIGSPGSKPYSNYLAGLNKKKAKANTTPADLAWAQSMVGHFKESLGSNTGPELDRLQKEFGTHAAEWCAEFATQALVKAGFPKGVKTPSVKTINDMASAGAFGLSFTSSPKPGDLVTFGNNHVAIVEKVNAHKGTVQTIAGNTGAGQVSRSTYAIGAGRYVSVDAAGAGVGAQGFGKPAVYHYPRIKQSDFMNFIQGQENHFDLMVGAHLMTQVQADAAKRAVLVGNIPELRGDTKLSALGMLRAVTQQQAADTIAARPRSVAGAMAAGVLQTRDDFANYAQILARRSGMDPNSVAGLQFAGKGLTSRVGADDAAINRIKAGIWDANNKGQKDIAKQLGDELKTVVADRNETLTQIAENTRATAQAVKDQLLSDNSTHAADLSSGGFLAGLTGTAKDTIGGILGQYGITTLPGGLSVGSVLGNPQGLSGAASGDIASLMGEVGSGQLTFADIWPQMQSDLQIIAGATTDTATNTLDLTGFWKDRAYALAQGLAISQAQYGVFKNFSAAPTPYLGGFDSGGIVPGPTGAAGFALVHGGETILPTHKQQAPIVQVLVSADARAAGVRIDTQMGRNARQLSVAPGH